MAAQRGAPPPSPDLFGSADAVPSEGAGRQGEARPPAATSAPSITGLRHDLQLVLIAVALGWSGKTRTWILAMLGEMGALDSKRRAFT
ncbi:MAG: hypothetical protein ABI564_06455, partial [Ideonella sp.]